MDADGNNIKKISEIQLEDSWMDTRNNGSEIMVAGRIGSEIRNQLFLINTENGSYKQITRDTSAYFRDPSFSPDGNKIAFVHRKNKRDITLNDEIYVMNIDGSDLIQLTDYPDSLLAKNRNGYKAGATHWHPTENFISYISMQNGRHHIYAVTPDGSKQWKLTKNTFTEGWHDWSEDGKWLTFDSSNESETQYHIMLMHWESGEITQVSDTTSQYQLSPVFMTK